MIRNMRDFAIFLLVMYVLVVAVTARMNPEWVGHWLAQKDVAYDTIWMEWVGDCDCTESLE
jgi:hypothetical protein